MGAIHGHENNSKKQFMDKKIKFLYFLHGQCIVAFRKTGNLGISLNIILLFKHREMIKKKINFNISGDNQEI